MIRREEESQLTAATVKLAKLVTGVTLVHNIAQQKGNVKSPISGWR